MKRISVNEEGGKGKDVEGRAGDRGWVGWPYLRGKERRRGLVFLLESGGLMVPGH